MVINPKDLKDEVLDLRLKKEKRRISVNLDPSDWALPLRRVDLVVRELYLHFSMNRKLEEHSFFADSPPGTKANLRVWDNSGPSEWMEVDAPLSGDCVVSLRRPTVPLSLQFCDEVTGLPVPGLKCRTSLGETATLGSDSQGRLQVRVPLKKTSIIVTSEEWKCVDYSSNIVRVDASDPQAREVLKVIVTKSTTLRGKVISKGRPAEGARVTFEKSVSSTSSTDIL